MNRISALIGLASVMLAVSCSGGSSLGASSDSGELAYSGVVEGYITLDGIFRGTSAVSGNGDGVEGVDVWCEDPGTGQRFGQDTTGPSGYYRMEGLPEGQDLMFKFQYHYGYQNGDYQQKVIEGAQQVRLMEREQLRLDAGICLYDGDGDGNADDSGCDNTQMQVMMREQTQAGMDGPGQSGGEGPDSGQGNGEQAQDQLRLQDGSCDGDCDGTGEGDGDCDGVQQRDRDQDCIGECEGDQSQERNREGDPAS